MTLMYFYVAIWEYRTVSSQSKKVLILLFAPILAAPVIPIMTVAYIGYVAYVFARKCVQPGYDHDDIGNDFSFMGMLKLIEAVAEANLQAVLGLFTSPLTIIIKPDLFH